jgi:hypothetical protein
MRAQVICWAPGQGSRVHDHGESHWHALRQHSY